MKYKMCLMLSLLFSFFLFIPKTKAEVVEAVASFNDVAGGTTVSVPANSTRQYTLYLYNYEGVTRPYVYLTFSVCATGPNNYTISNVGYSNYFVEDSIEYYPSGKYCKINSNNEGWLYYVQVKVGKYEDIDGTGEELVASSFFNITNTWSYGVLYQIKNFYLSSDDTMEAIRNNKEILDKFNAIEEDITSMNSNLSSINGILSSNNDKLDQTNDKLDDVNDNLGDLNDFLNDSNVNIDGLENSAGWLPAGPVDSILNLPLSLYENLLDTLQDGSSCPVLNINLPFIDETLPISCLSDIFSKIDGLNVFWTWVGTISGAFLLFNYLLHLYKWVDDTLTFRENNHFGGY